VPSGSRWIHEIKFDGYRVQAHLHNEAVKIFTRRGHDWTNRFKKVASDAWRIKASSAVIDGEIVVPAADGSTDFSVLQNELRGSSKRIVLVAFDLLYLNGRDLRKLPLHQRKAELKKIVAGTDVQFSESFEIEGADMFAHACKLGLEGVVSKVRDSTYVSGRGNNWVKKTCAQRETLTIAGFALDGTKWDGLYVGRRKGPDLVYAGKVDHGFDKTSTAELRRRLEPLVRKTQPYAKQDRPQGRLGRAEAARGDRVPREVGRGKGPARLVCGAAAASMCARDGPSHARNGRIRTCTDSPAAPPGNRSSPRFRIPLG
jgi:bifunctional non-homologous end joining protein LigD